VSDRLVVKRLTSASNCAFRALWLRQFHRRLPDFSSAMDADPRRYRCRLTVQRASARGASFSAVPRSL
jgi:hypothetical protein